MLRPKMDSLGSLICPLPSISKSPWAFFLKPYPPRYLSSFPLVLHPIFRIDELTLLIIGELVETSPPAAVPFVLTFQSLEDPTLSSFWREQRFLTVLVKALPGHT